MNISGKEETQHAMPVFPIDRASLAIYRSG
jgi:hypothetical protein